MGPEGLNFSEKWGVDSPEKVNPFPDSREEAESWVRGSMAKYGCPFAWLLNDFPFDPITAADP